MVEEDELQIEFKDEYECPFCGSQGVSHEKVILVEGAGNYCEVLCDFCGETLAYQCIPETGD